ASILSSPVTLISSSSNIVVSGLITRYGMPPLGLFELSLVGILVTVVGVAYMYFIGQRLIPQRPEDTFLEDQGRSLPYSTEIVVLPDSPLIGKPVSELAEDDQLNLRVMKVGGDNGALMIPNTGRPIQAGDVLLVEGQRDELLKIKDVAGVDFKIAEPDGEVDLKPAMTTVEGMILPGSTLIGQSLRRLRFRERYGIQVLGIHRSGRTIDRKISRTLLRVGDQLILKAEPERIALLGRTRNIRIIGGLDDAVPRLPKARWAAAIFLGSLVIGALGLVPLAVAALVGGFLMLATRTISPEEAYREVEWRVVILIGAMLAVGQAMESTGAAALFARQITDTIGQAPVWILLSAFFFLTLLLTQPMSNQAAAVVVVPVAIQAALQLGLNPRTFAVIIAVAASTSYMTPLEPACMIVYGPGRYRFADFLKVGTPLTALVYVIAILTVPLLWPVR
ncbi:MAG TPA: SLC13 family permease, partial [Anaerolineaceae bacterium]|nr:SLC13 family permease [Anaerolineaceae bacterium]